MYGRLSDPHASYLNEDSTQTASLLESKPLAEFSHKTSHKREIVLNLLLDACIRLGQVERAVSYVESILKR